MKGSPKVRALSLRQRILLLTMLTTGSGLLLASGGYVIFDTHTAKQQKLKQLDITADLIGTSTAASLAFDDSDSAEKFLDVLETQPAIRGAVLYTATGKLLAEYVRPGEKAFHEPAAVQDGEVWTKQSLKLARPVEHDGKRIGTIYLESDLNDLYESRIKRFEKLTAEVALGRLDDAWA